MATVALDVQRVRCSSNELHAMPPPPAARWLLDEDARCTGRREARQFAARIFFCLGCVFARSFALLLRLLLGVDELFIQLYWPCPDGRSRPCTAGGTDAYSCLPKPCMAVYSVHTMVHTPACAYGCGYGYGPRATADGLGVGGARPARSVRSRAWGGSPSGQPP